MCFCPDGVIIYLYRFSIVCMYDIRFIDSDEWDEAMTLSYETFLQFDAPMFTQNGIAGFVAFLQDENIKREFDEGSYYVVGAYEFNKLVGVISLRNKNHISLLFVEKNHLRKGIGRQLIMETMAFARTRLRQKIITVNSSPYAVEFYKSCGFIEAGEEVDAGGIQYTPMEYYF